jgi:hypothetical protein
VINGSLDVPAGIILTVAPGTVVKSEGDLQVDGSLDAVGTSSQPITFTSIDDNTVGGVTGTGTPDSGDWGGIYGQTTASLDLENADVRYATNGLNLSGGTDSIIKIDNDHFDSNGTAVSLSAALTTNASITDNTFTDNSVAIDAESNWSTATISPVECAYLPTINATGNTFWTGTAYADGPVESQSDVDSITDLSFASNFGLPVELYPEDWTSNLTAGTMDTISFFSEPCFDVKDPEDSYAAIAVPLNLTGAAIVPIDTGS